MYSTDHKPLIIIAGPTAVGKSALGIELAGRIGGEIVSADSMQVYRHMDIGTAKIKPEEMNGVPHHLIDILEPTDSFHVADFKELAAGAIEDIYSRDNVPILVGGTGFYIQAVLYDVDFQEEPESDIRDRLTELAENEGVQALHKLLEETDPLSAARLHPNDVKRHIRAIEYFKVHGHSITEQNETQRGKESPYSFAYYVLTDDRQSVYDRIDARVDKMMDEGLIQEVRSLTEMGCRPGMTSMQGIGYKQVLMALSNEIDMDEAVRLIKRDSRHFAKRQLTWFNREKDIRWISREDYPDACSQADHILEDLKQDGYFY